METPNTNWMDEIEISEKVKTRFIESILMNAFQNGETSLSIFRTNMDGKRRWNIYGRYFDNGQRRARIAQFLALWFGLKIERPPVILDQDERADLEQRLYDAERLEHAELEY